MASPNMVSVGRPSAPLAFRFRPSLHHSREGSEASAGHLLAQSKRARLAEPHLDIWAARLAPRRVSFVTASGAGDAQMFPGSRPCPELRPNAAMPRVVPGVTRSAPAETAARPRAPRPTPHESARRFPPPKKPAGRTAKHAPRAGFHAIALVHPGVGIASRQSRGLTGPTCLSRREGFLPLRNPRAGPQHTRHATVST